MAQDDPLRALGRIEEAVLELQARQHPGRPLFYALARLLAELRRVQREASAAARTP
jgi:hypothetical protein